MSKNKKKAPTDDGVESMSEAELGEVAGGRIVEGAASGAANGAVNEAEDLLEVLDKSTKLDINRRLAYPKDSVGRLMSEEVGKISTGLTVKEALVELKTLHENVEDLIYV